MLEFLSWLLPPSRLKNAILQRFGHSISPTASIGPIFVFGVDRFELGEDVRIWPFSVIKGLRLVRLDKEATIRAWNWISAAAEFREGDPQAGTLDLGYGSGVGARHLLDCSGAIILQPYANIGGGRSILQTVDFDSIHERQTAGRIVLGQHSLVGSRAALLKGAYLPDQSVLASNSVLYAPTTDEPQRQGLYAGAPATWRAETRGAWFDRIDPLITEHIIDGPMGPEPDSSVVAE
jgi:acetyltransferase-like isoleucine patch superfamily enzyme